MRESNSTWFRANTILIATNANSTENVANSRATEPVTRWATVRTKSDTAIVIPAMNQIRSDIRLQMPMTSVTVKVICEISGIG